MVGYLEGDGSLITKYRPAAATLEMETGLISTVTVKAGDSLDKIARDQGKHHRVAEKAQSSGANVAPRSGTEISESYHEKGDCWRETDHDIKHPYIYYNGGGDSLYVKKLDDVLPLIRKVKVGICAQ